MIKRVNRESGIVGEGKHRSGWPYVLRSLEPMFSVNGILFDDFIEVSFAHQAVTSPYNEPWVGVFHQPHGVPESLQTSGQSISSIIESPMFRASLPNLKLGIALSSSFGDWLQQALGVPFASLVHPTETQVSGFSEDGFLANKEKRIIQVGCSLRNTRAIYQLKAPAGWTKTCLSPDARWAVDYVKRVVSYWQDINRNNGQGRKPNGIVEKSAPVPNDVYDHLLSENVIFVEFFAAAANNTVVECIVRNTPLVINRLPALEEYLGKDYPLFYERIEDATGLFSTDRILEGHAYLKRLDKRPFSGEYFRLRLTEALSDRGLA